jgi:uncharacterized protein (DUF1697 family)
VSVAGAGRGKKAGVNRHVAFLRGMNLGGRRITNAALCAEFEALGMANVAAFLASGNVVFDASQGDPDALARRIEEGLTGALGYPVPTFLRSAAQVRSIAAHAAFDRKIGTAGGKVQVALLTAAPETAAREAVLGLSTEADRLAVEGRELFWLPQGGISQSDLDLAAIERELGRMTIRTQRTMERLAAKFLDA